MKIRPDYRTLLSALLLAAALPPWDLGLLVWVALVPWLAALRESKTAASAAVQGFWLSFALGLASAYWMATALHEFLMLPWPLAILGLVVFAALLAQPNLVLFAILVHWTSRRLGAASVGARAPLLCVVLALAYAGLDWMTPRLFDVGLGYALHDFERLRQLADLGGVRLLTGLVVAVNLLIWRADVLPFWRQTGATTSGPRDVRMRRASCAATLVVLVGAASVYGLVRHREVADIVAKAERRLPVAVVQGSVDNDVRLAWARGDERAAERQLSTYMLLTEELMAEPARPELVVWPEATFPGVFRQPRSKLQLGRANKFDRQVLRHHTPIVFGGYDLEEIDGRSTLFNSLFAITPSYARAGGLGSVQRYHKHELLPFAETIPGLSRADWLRAILPGLALFGRGAGAGVLPIVTPSGETVRLSPIICSESLQTGHVLEGVREGGDVIVNIGSDGWFGDRGEPQLHLAIARFRSVETRRSQIRAANTGISALIGPDGAIDRATTIGESGVLRGEVPIVSGPGTLLLSWGDWFGPVSLAVSAILLGLLLGSGRIAARAADPSSGSDAIDGATDAR